MQRERSEQYKELKDAQQRPATAGAAVPSTDLYSLLLPATRDHVRRGSAPVWERHFQQQHSKTPQASVPSRPRSSSHRPTRCASVASPRRSIAINTPRPMITPRCKRADTSSPRRQTATSCDLHLSPSPAARDREDEPGPTPVRSRQQIIVNSNQVTQQVPIAHLPLRTDAREHTEMKACLLAYMHRINVDSLQQMRDKAMEQIDSIRARQLVARGGILDDGSLTQTTKRKTLFLLRHFFSLGNTETTRSPSRQDAILHDVIDEWAVHDDASEREIDSLWKSIVDHIERSYVLRHHLVPQFDPDPLSITVAMDCLRKLPGKLPAYQRMLNVIITLVESGLYAKNDMSRSAQSVENTTPDSKKRFYFEEYQAVRIELNKEVEDRLRHQEAERDKASERLTPTQQFYLLLEMIDRDISGGKSSIAEKEALLQAFIRSDSSSLVPVSLHDSLAYCFDPSEPREKLKSLFFNIWIPLLGTVDAQRVLEELTLHHLQSFRTFFRNNLEAVDRLLVEADPPIQTSQVIEHDHDSVLASPTNQSLSLFQGLIERHSAKFASVLWSTPYLTAHIFQDSQHLIARILEQNVMLISGVLQQRSDVLLALLNHTLRDNAAVMEEFLLNHPKAFSDILLNRTAAIAAAVKTHPSILGEILQASRATLPRVLLSMPDLLCHLFKSTPDLLARTIREDVTLLPLVFSLVPQCLCDALEWNPEVFVNIAHRKPTLVSKIFAKHPDLLLEPLEANPSVFSNFLVYHRKILPDFSDPNFDSTLIQFERKQLLDASQQTEKRLYKYDGKLRLRERLKLQEEALVVAIRQTGAGLHATGHTTPVSGAGEKPKDPRIQAALVLPASSQVVGEVARLYIAKLEQDAADDLARKRRRPLVDFVLDIYIQEIGYKSKAQRKLTLLLMGAKQSEHESLRIRWFVRFMNAIASDDESSITSVISATTATGDPIDVRWWYHPLAVDFYLSSLQFLVALPSDQLSQRLEDELSRPCLVGYTRLKQFLEDPIMTRMLPTKEQRLQVLAMICEKETTIHGGVGIPEGSTSIKNGAVTVTMLHLEGALDSLMAVWIQYQDFIRSEWVMEFQLANPDGSGVMRYNVFADLVRSKIPTMDDRSIMKIYHQCGEENDLGEYCLIADDFSLTMCVTQEKDTLRELAARVAS